MEYPKISIITPSYNQGQYIEEAILSVIGQNYPNLEYIIIDGGSTDNSVEIIRKYEKHLAYWVSEPDKGQSDAINKGFEKATGDILGWLNSDDLYMPCVFNKIFNLINIEEKELIFGNVIHFNNETHQVYGSDTARKFNSYHLPFDRGYLIQPATFWTRRLWDSVGNLNEKYHYTFDWEWFLRASQSAKLTPVSIYLAMYRIHSFHKSGTGGDKRFQEILSVLYQSNFEKYAKILENSVPNRGKIFKYIDRISKLKLGHFKNTLLRIFFSEYFKNLNNDELSEILIKIRTVR